MPMSLRSWSSPLTALTLLLSGCVTVYQPMAALQRPVVIDTKVANFEGLRLFVNCHTSDYLDRTGAQILCRKVSTLLANQGAAVRTNIELGEDEGETADGVAVTKDNADLTIDLNARLLHIERNAILWVISVCSLTLLPAISEYTFAQDVTIRDASGFLLASESLKARFVRHFGGGYWVLNWLLDKTVREESERLSGNAQSEEFSRDFYGQMSQMVFNARARLAVLREGESAAARN
jgi:hypothetical protein